MGHAGAIVAGGTGTAEEKVQALEASGVRTAARPSDVVGLIREELAG